ncbi:MAG TPA: UDPGP type 1 family protein [Planctomycetes bacterium]|nr:UDPGP type 1 family protein [Planctomycetota bacterium]
MELAPSQREGLQAAGQGHALRRLDRLAPGSESHGKLAGQLAAIDLVLLERLRGLGQGAAPTGGSFDPPELFPLERSAGHRERAREAVACGSRLLAEGRVGYVLVAGGQASRLGYDAPKGDYPIGPVTDRTLFAYHAHRIDAARRRTGKSMPWYVMTSPVNDAATRAIFERDGFFGLPPEDVVFFSQDLLPALDAEGHLLFAAEDSLFLAPNGHGGCLLGLSSSGALADMRERGIEFVSYFQVDNPLARPADPLFLGLHALEEADMSTKVVEKRDAAEKVGVIGHIDGKLGCIEYSDLPAEAREARDETGRLRFRAGNIAMHVFSLPFLEEVTQGELELPWHVANKRMACVDEGGRPIDVDGVKFETFVFDALAHARRSVTLEVDRAFEFSPVKNREGEDSPATARADLCRLFADWVRAAGRDLPAPGPDGLHPVEVDPRVAETGEEFAARAVAPREHDGGHVYGV